MPTKSDPLRPVTNMILAVAALATSVGAMIRTGDKSVEKTAYEVLAEKIVELQRENEDLRHIHPVMQSEEDDDTPTTPAPTDSSFWMIPGANSAVPSAIVTTAHVLEVPPVEIFVTITPPASASQLHPFVGPPAADASARASRPERSAKLREPLRPPPSWSKLKPE